MGLRLTFKYLAVTVQDVFKLTSIRIVNILHDEVSDSFPPIQNGHKPHVVQQDGEF
jgi:hypothetical protein